MYAARTAPAHRTRGCPSTGRNGDDDAIRGDDHPLDREADREQGQQRLGHEEGQQPEGEDRPPMCSPEPPHPTPAAPRTRKDQVHTSPDREGAWIETSRALRAHVWRGYRPPRGGVDQNQASPAFVLAIGPLRSGVRARIGTASPAVSTRKQRSCPPRAGIDRSCSAASYPAPAPPAPASTGTCGSRARVHPQAIDPCYLPHGLVRGPGHAALRQHGVVPHGQPLFLDGAESVALHPMANIPDDTARHTAGSNVRGTV